MIIPNFKHILHYFITIEIFILINRKNSKSLNISHIISVIHLEPSI